MSDSSILAQIDIPYDNENFQKGQFGHFFWENLKASNFYLYLESNAVSTVTEKELVWNQPRKNICKHQFENKMIKLPQVGGGIQNWAYENLWISDGLVDTKFNHIFQFSMDAG